MKRIITITIVFALCTMTLALAVAWREITNRERKAFDYESIQIVTLLTDHINAAFHLSENFQSFFNASDFVEVDEFRTYSEDALSNCASVKIAAYCPKIEAKKLKKFIEHKRYWGIMNYNVFRFDNQLNSLEIEEKDFYYPLTYCEPYTPENVVYLGCDINSLDNIKHVINKAILSGKPEHHFGDRTLFRNPNDFIIIIPVYEGKKWPTVSEERVKNNNGIVVLVVNTNNLLDKNAIPDNISVSITPEYPEKSHSPILNINAYAMPDSIGITNLTEIYTITANSQNFKIKIGKIIDVSSLNLWLLTLAFSIASAFTAGMFLILKNRFELSQELRLRIKTQNELIKHRDNLEEIVKDRTKELSQKNLTLKNEIRIREKAENELRSTTSQLIRSEKLATIGQIAAGVAHEVNTPLGAIGSTNSTMQKVFEELIYNLNDEANIISSQNMINKLIDKIYSTNNNLSSREIRQYKNDIKAVLAQNNVENAELVTTFLTNTGIVNDFLEFLPLFQNTNSDKILKLLQKIAIIINGNRIIDSAVNQSSRVILALKDYARTEQFQEMTETNLQETINTALLLWKNKIKHGIDIVTEFDNVPPVLCHSHELCQVWTNLIQNAIQAMDNNGSITISLKQINDYLQVKIADTGPGIPDDIQGKIFEPLFTTKSKGEGTGLGLDISKRIIDRHNGTITLNSTSKGSTFTVTIPISSRNNSDNKSLKIMAQN